MGLKWKSWKYDLKRKSYDPSLTVDEIVGAQTDSRVDKVQFKNLVTLWFSEEAQVESEKSKRIRSKSNEPHVTGSKSFARLIHDETKKKGVRPSRAMVYRMSRTRKDGSIVNGPAVEIMDKLQAISDASVSDNDGGTTEGNGGVMDWKNGALAKVKGPEKGGRIRCLGKVVVCKSQGSRSNDDQVPALKAKIHELQDEIKDMKEKRVDEAKELKEMRERQEVMVRFMSAVKEQLPNLNISSIFNDLNTQVDNDAYSAYEHNPNVNPTSSHASRNQISDPRNKGKR